MTILTYLIAYCGVAIFLVAVFTRFMTWSKMPMHMRWELYPVAHEGGGKAAYGGSYLEESDWWTKKREVSLFGELKVMVPEILFLVALKEHNKKLWTRSFPFHFGLYLVAGCTLLMILAGILGALAPSVMEGTVGTVFGYLIPITGYAGLGLGLLGAFALILRRLATPLRDYSAPMDVGNLVFFVVAFGTALATALLVDRGFETVSLFVRNLATFNVAALPGGGLEALLPSVSAILLAGLVAYIPLTHMSHFVGKYFAYHAIRWADEPNLPGGKQEPVIHDLLNKPVTWSAPHIKGDGKKTWLDVATEDQSK
jgi:nitrate reductase gamma subunit